MSPINKSLVTNLLAAYKVAWETHDEGVLAAIFCEDACYEEKPGITYEGIGEITNYWRHNSQQQSDVHFEWDNLIINDQTVKVSWQANFHRDDLREYWHLKGVFELTIDLKSGKISRLSEKFNRI